jgi:transposase InsO family protein
MADGSQGALDVLVIAAALRRDRSRVAKRARAEAWPYTEHKVRGGRRKVFDLLRLPPDVQEAVNRHVAINAASLAVESPAASKGRAIARGMDIAEKVDGQIIWRQRQAGTAKMAGITGRALERMDARIHLLNALNQFAKERRIGICAALKEFSVAYGSGDLYVPIGVRNVIGSDVSPATLRRWQGTLRAQGAAALAGEYGKRAGSGRIESDEQLRDFVLAMLVERPHVSAKLIYRALGARFADRALPPLRNLQRYLARWKRSNAQLFTAIANPDAWKNRYMVAHGRVDEDIVRLNQRWEFDSTPADVQLVDGRYTIIGVIDIWSRRGLLCVSKTSSAAGVCGAIRRAILEWGVPEEAKLDNGQDYVSHRVQRVFASLGVSVNLSAPFSPWQKPHIERFFRTFSHDLVELLPGYSGHNVADAQALRASKSFAERLMKKGSTLELKLTAAELQRVCDQWCEKLYSHEPREALSGATVFERVASSRAEVRRITDERVLDHLLAEAPDGHGGRSVTKKGIRVDGHLYSAPELWPHVGERVRVLYDERDLGRIVVYRDDAFVCIATCPEIEGVSRAEVAAVARERQKEGIETLRREAKANARKLKLRDIAFEILDKKQSDAAALAALPPPNVTHLTPAIEAAQAAADAEIAAAETPRASAPVGTISLESIRDVLRSEHPAEDETPEGRFRVVMALELKQLNGEELCDIERARLRAYQDSSEYRARRQIFEYWGPEFMQLGPEYRALLRDGRSETERLYEKHPEEKPQGV